jgi:hypothetical protein
MTTYGGVDVQNHVSLTSALGKGEWTASRPGRFTPRERAPGAHWIWGLVGHGTGLDEVEKILSLPGLELRPLGRLANTQSLYRVRYRGQLLSDTAGPATDTTSFLLLLIVIFVLLHVALASPWGYVSGRVKWRNGWV